VNNKIDHHIDLMHLPDAITYEDKYRGYLKVFEEIAYLSPDIEVIVENAPWCWYPLLYHLNCKIIHSKIEFRHCPIVRELCMFDPELDRTSVEVLCEFRPETVDALWKVDIQWNSQRRRKYPTKKEFIITSNGGFFRKEILDFIDLLQKYHITKPNVVMVPCASDKPYPSPLHRKVLEMMPNNYYMAVVTGALGLVPQDLWDRMPWYDSGLPNNWRLQNIVAQYFSINPHDNIIVYCDNQSAAIMNGFKVSNMLSFVTFVNPWEEVIGLADYLDLLDPVRLARLEAAFKLRS